MKILFTLLIGVLFNHPLLAEQIKDVEIMPHDDELPTLVIETIYKDPVTDVPHQCIAWSEANDGSGLDYLTLYPISHQSLRVALETELEVATHELQNSLKVSGAISLIHLLEFIEFGPAAPIAVGIVEGVHLTLQYREIQIAKSVQSVLDGEGANFEGEQVYRVRVNKKDLKSVKHFLENHHLDDGDNLGSCRDILEMRRLAKVS